ncbi:DUF397 domain-containing protein [Streptomyces himalayensis]|uniref:DUF397 domain-containing protein n=1 Tax=Streptomyces himalayensis TaxID=2820085 RepID=UPI0035E40F63
MTFVKHVPPISVSELDSLIWRKSTHSGDDNACVEHAPLPSGRQAVRDSKDPGRGILHFGPGAWRVFVESWR